MCTGAEMMMMGGQVAGGFSKMAYGDAQNSLARADANYERDASQQQAEKILRAARSQKSTARANTAGSGVRIDEFSLGVEQEIDELANQDAAMTILSGKRKAMSLEFGGDMAKRAGRSEFMGSLFSAGATGYSGWKGAKAKSEPSFRKGQVIYSED